MIFGGEIGCMDARPKAAVRKFLRDQFGVDAVDQIPYPGMNKFLAETQGSKVSILLLPIYILTGLIFWMMLKKIHQIVTLLNIRRMIAITVTVHKGRVLAITGHDNCAGNPTTREKQIKHLVAARRYIESLGFEIPIVVLWIRGDWRTVDVIGSSGEVIRTHTYHVRIAAKI